MKMEIKLLFRQVCWSALAATVAIVTIISFLLLSDSELLEALNAFRDKEDLSLAVCKLRLSLFLKMCISSYSAAALSTDADQAAFSAALASIPVADPSDASPEVEGWVIVDADAAKEEDANHAQAAIFLPRHPRLFLCLPASMRGLSIPVPVSHLHSQGDILVRRNTLAGPLLRASFVG